MKHIRTFSLLFHIFLLLVFQSMFFYPQDLTKDSKTNPAFSEERLIPQYASRALLVAVNKDQANKPRFAFPIRDLEIAADVTKAIYTDPILSKYDINFKVKNNRVYLFGKVDLDGVREYAQQVAAKVTGVQDVQNDINYYQDKPQDSYSQDMTLLQNIYDRYESSPAVKIENVHVSVYNQTVRLSGVVSSNYEKNAAESEAIKAGAKEVYNLLVVGEGPEMHEIKNQGDFVTWPN